mmetsp:Transcript_27829/g.45913  ORF Transcript_27829/g.45913 Transcript_27829/m.45913 type:complete len:232 (-) Transcript_27829:135-830(-)
MPVRQLEQTAKNLTEDQRKRAVKNSQTGRKKTSIACIHCKRAKTRCAVERPCPRCIRLHKTCVDRPLKNGCGKKKRGGSSAQGQKEAACNSPNDACDDKIAIDFVKLQDSSQSLCTIGNVNNLNEIVTYHRPSDIPDAWLLYGNDSNRKFDDHSESNSHNNKRQKLHTAFEQTPSSSLKQEMPQLMSAGVNAYDFVNISAKNGIANEQAYIAMLLSIETEYRKQFDELPFN